MEISAEEPKGFYGESEAQAIYGAIRQEGDFIGFARRFMRNDDYRVTRNALWVLTKASDEELSQLQVILHELIDLAMQTEHSSVRRLSLNIVIRLKMDVEDLRAEFLDFCFEHMLDIEEFPGVQTLCMKIAYRMCKFYPELMDELRRTLEAMRIEYYKPAVRNVQHRILSAKLK